MKQKKIEEMRSKKTNSAASFQKNNKKNFWPAPTSHTKRLAPSLPPRGLSSHGLQAHKSASAEQRGPKAVLEGKKLQRISLSDDCKSIIYGTLLGDGCLKKTHGYKKARLSIRHSYAQAEYFYWIVAKLQEIVENRGGDSHQPSTKSVQKQAPNGFLKLEKLLFQSQACTELSEIMSITHHNNRLLIQRRWCNHLTPLSLAIWWCDEGSIISNGRKGVLCTDGFDETSVRLLANYLKTVWGIYVHVGAIKRDRKYGNYSKSHYFRLWFSTEELKKWLRIIMPHIPVASMLYKVILVYKHSLFQQRWISEVKSALPQFVNQIDEHMHKLKNKSENDIVQKRKELLYLVRNAPKAETLEEPRMAASRQTFVR